MSNTPEHGLIFALLPPAASVRPLVEQLRKEGVPDEAIQVHSTLPLAQVDLRAPPRIPLSMITIIAGLIGIGVGMFFAGGTAALYPILTGGKPIVALPVVGIISYETMMLLAIVATFIVMAIRIRHDRIPAIGHDPRIDDGYLGVAIVMTPGDPRIPSIQTLLKSAGAVEMQTR